MILFRWEPLSQFFIFIPLKSISLKLFTPFHPQPLSGFLTIIHSELLHKPLPSHTAVLTTVERLDYEGKGWVFLFAHSIYLFLGFFQMYVASTL